MRGVLTSVRYCIYISVIYKYEFIVIISVNTVVMRAFICICYVKTHVLHLSVHTSLSQDRGGLVTFQS